MGSYRFQTKQRASPRESRVPQVRLVPSRFAFLALLCWLGSGGAVAVDLQEPALSESSGLAFSNRRPQRIWTHNDSGGTAILYAFDSNTGKRTGSCHLNDVQAKDWESMSAYVDAKGKPRLIVADCGDNDARRENIQLHLFNEPDPDQDSRLDSGQCISIRVRHAGGPVDCEAIAVHLPTQSIILVSKGRFPVARVATIPLNAFDQPNQMVTTTPLVRLPFPMITGMDINLKTGDIWLASYFSLLRIPRLAKPAEDRESLFQQFRSDPVFQNAPPVNQLEAIACDRKGDVWISSEGRPAKLLRVTTHDD